jgi:hypothetical protein
LRRQNEPHFIACYGQFYLGIMNKKYMNLFYPTRAAST